MTGTLYGLGLGPGDPELLTLKALRLLRTAPVIAYPATESGDSFARAIVAQWLSPAQREIAIRFPMRPGPPPAAIYDGAAAQLIAALAAGNDLVYLCQGDPLFYGSFAGILTRLAGQCRIAVVPGVSSLTACAAMAGLPLVQRNGVLSVVPANLAELQLRAALARIAAAGDAAAIIKLGRHAAKLRLILQELQLLDRAVYVERASLQTQRIAPLAAVDPAQVPYFATVLIAAAAASETAL
ncbi:MAG: precorrin-2 C(20)-methyltransferase [Thiohalocapsa sp.]